MKLRDNRELIKKLYDGKAIRREEWYALLTALTANEKEALRSMAASVAEEKFGRGVYIRGLIEISSYCRNNCYYCGLRAGNALAQRYRLTKEDILECCEQGSRLGFNTFVLQGGEDAVQNDEWLTDVVRAIRAAHPEKAITLSVGERGEEAYHAFRKAGADRYLLRHETRNDEHYSLLHPRTMSASNRRECLSALKRAGFQTGSGMMIGSPGQTTEHLIDDLQFLEELQPEMIGIGPFIPAAGTPFAGEPAGSIDTTLLLISLLRLRFPSTLIPATTALATLHPEGRKRAILAGANVIMPNLSPRSVRSKYSIYDNKATGGSESAEDIEKLEKELNAIGYHINYARGDYKI
ncbi:MAG: [FeFe] hydrogenase H-cluster radical SAM maturase HydE [Bacteroidales bacterium]|nr:[FeFe] hydrogenase H-cluster radical SAM maturase HydE [Bacteroidales bacterium]